MLKMNTKNLMVFSLIIASVLLLVSTVSAATTEAVTIDSVKIDGLYDTGSEDISVIAGETVTVKVYFNASVTAADVRVKAEIEGTKVDVESKTSSFNLEEGKRYTKTLTLRVPYELQDEASDDLALNIKVWNGEFKTEHSEITLRVQRPSYNADVMSISASQTAQAGDLFAVDVVLKNTGYNSLDDLRVTTKISELGVERTSYFGDLVSLECTESSESCDEDDEDTSRGRFYLQIPYDAKSGIYTIEVEAVNSDLSVSEVSQVVVKNNLPSVAIKSGSDLLLVNPTNKLKVYKVVTPADEQLVVLQAGSSKTVPVTIEADSEGKYDFEINVFSGDELVDTVAFSGEAENQKVTNPIVVLTVILSIIFIVLLIVLVILIGKKPEKTEEFGESYY
jgi:hypothetical protein